MRLLITILFAGGGVFLLQSYVQPELVEVQNLRREQEVVTETIREAREVIRMRDEKLGTYNSIVKADIEKVRKFLPAGSALSEFLVDVDTLVKEADITVQSIAFLEDVPSVGDGTMASDAHTLTVTLGIEGSYENFRELLTLFERNLRLIDIVRISLRGQPASDGKMQFELVLQAYYQGRTLL